ncbi:uncharacterized conserved protein [Hahella chejuensis KCTC 2396]|uniref:Uncharacterized conserved protein n=1 Tax=Hahella chejuensis (strain KCTC 2396) TaxID=349521 RepID=Q2SME2_HAHCH|nr:aldehyde-activating protein [Hahella chejuensis]ABC28182.1 uncharacterized conserved protein [Hahella chejuensis KCTC 2396]
MEITCHCGNVKLSMARPPAEVGKCNCSICRRYAALWGYYSPEEVEIGFEKEKSVFYIWGDRELEFHRCNLCGCVTHYVTTPKCPGEIVAINMNMAPLDVLATIPVREIHGAD